MKSSFTTLKKQSSYPHYITKKVELRNQNSRRERSVKSRSWLQRHTVKWPALQVLMTHNAYHGSVTCHYGHPSQFQLLSEPLACRQDLPKHNTCYIWLLFATGVGYLWRHPPDSCSSGNRNSKGDPPLQPQHSLVLRLKLLMTSTNTETLTWSELTHKQKSELKQEQ